MSSFSETEYIITLKGLFKTDQLCLPRFCKAIDICDFSNKNVKNCNDLYNMLTDWIHFISEFFKIKKSIPEKCLRVNFK